MGQAMTTQTHPTICPRCKKRERERIDGEQQWYCEVCNDDLAAQYREQKEWERYHD